MFTCRIENTISVLIQALSLFLPIFSENDFCRPEISKDFLKYSDGFVPRNILNNLQSGSSCATRRPSGIVYLTFQNFGAVVLNHFWFAEHFLGQRTISCYPKLYFASKFWYMVEPFNLFKTSQDDAAAFWMRTTEKTVFKRFFSSY